MVSCIVAGCGGYQVLHYILSQLITFSQAFNMTMMAFGKVVPKWTCSDWAFNQTTDYANFSAQSLQNCKRLLSEGCQNMTMTAHFESVVFQWKLLCDDMPIVFFAMTLQMLGVILGSQFWGMVSDWYGRKWSLFAALAGLISCGMGSIFSPNMTVFTVFRFVIGCFLAGTIGTNHVYFNEFIISKHRLWIGCINNWSISYMLMAFVAWRTGEWKLMTVVCNGVAVPALFLICFMKESPRWLLQKGRNTAARRSINHVIKLNRSKVDSDVSELFTMKVDTNASASDKKSRRYSFWHLYSTSQMAKHTVVLSVCYFTLAIISYGIMFDTDSLAGNMLLNFFLFAAVRFSASCLTILADRSSKCIGRKQIFIFPLCILLLCCVTICYLKAFGYARTTAETAFSMLAIMSTSPLWTSAVLTTTELYPTPVRNLALGYISSYSSVGAAIAPQVLYLAKLWPSSTYVIYAILGLLSCILHLIFIPETKGHSLPENMPVKVPKKSGQSLFLQQNPNENMNV